MNTSTIPALALATVLLSIAGCQPSTSTSTSTSPSSSPSTSGKGALGAVDVPAPRGRPLLVVTKNASCGCCSQWVDAMRRAGFDVQVHDVDNLDPIKTTLGVPVGKGACHTAEIEGYFVEGHVPAEDIRRLLETRPDARGLVLPGMPAGAPGMEMPGGDTTPYTVELVRMDGSTEVFARHGGPQGGR